MSGAQDSAEKVGDRQLMTLPEQIAERIFFAIEQGSYVPSERIREELVAEQYGVSRGTVREAMRILERDAVVSILPNRGAHVTQLSTQEVGDIFEIRRNLIGVMVRRLHQRKDTLPSLIERMSAEVLTLEELAVEPGAGEAYLAISDRLARMLAQGAGNARLADMLASLARQTRRYSKLGLATMARRRASANTWRKALQALQCGDVNSASHAIEELIDASRCEAIRQLQLAAVTSRELDQSHAVSSSS